MEKTTVGKQAPRRAKPLAGGTLKRGKGRVKAGAVPSGNARFEAVMRAAEQSGLLGGKHARIGGRVSPDLVRQAKRQTGIVSDTDLLEFALATVALEDNFEETFKKSRGKVDPELKLGF
ncbi:MAG: hypothetical protein ACLPPF_06190 [Rhodomicrobium sp.]